MLPSVPGEGHGSSNGGAVDLMRRRGRKRAGWLVARDTAGVSAGSAALGLVVSIGANSSLAGLITGGTAWLASCAGVAVLAWWRNFRNLGTDTIDPWALPEPWRGLVRDAVNAGRRFEVATASLPPGPLRDHVTALEPAVAKHVRAVWESAQRGATLTGGLPTATRPESTSSLSRRLRSLQEERASAGEGAPDRLAELDRAEAAVASRLREAKRAESVATWLEDGLRSSIGRLEAAITSLAELGGEPSAPEGGADLALSLDSVGEELSALQAGLREVGGTLPLAGGLPENRLKP